MARKKPPPVKVTLREDGTIDLDPPTLTCRRKGKTKHKITWERDDAGEEFSFVDCYVAPIDRIRVDGKKNRVTARNRIRKKSGTNEWHYVLVLKDKSGKVHRSVGVGPSITGGRGVIRNED
jgi:hypothetical protein